MELEFPLLCSQEPADFSFTLQVFIFSVFTTCPT